MKISHSRAKENLSNGGENRVPDITILPWHGAGLDAAFEAVSHHHVIALAQLLDKGIQVLEVIAVIRVAHDAIAPVRRC